MQLRSAARFLLSICLLMAVEGCAFFKQADHFESRPVAFAALDGWNDDYHAQALATFLSACPSLVKSKRGATSESGIRVSAEIWQSLCTDAMALPRDNNISARAFFERRFVPYRISNNKKETGLFTGYYVPTLYGSLTRKKNYAYPLYRMPPDVKNGSPYYTHAQIAAGALAGRGLELLWVDDPVMLFFTQVQGSGRVRLDNGMQMLMGYAGKNNHPYVSLGKIMGDEGLLPKDGINFYTIRQLLYDHPERAFELMQRNPSYVFFKRLDQPGAVGAIGSVLAPQRSLAVDNRYIPYGLPLFLETELPALPQQMPQRFHRLMLAQDTGGAIRGPVRGDVFFGEGSQAEYFAGNMKGRGVYTLLVPNEITDQMH